MFGLKVIFNRKFKTGYWAILLVDMWILLWNNVQKFHLVKFVPFGYVLSQFPSCEYWVKKVRILTKKSEPNQNEPNQSNWNFLKPPRAPWSYFCLCPWTRNKCRQFFLSLDSSFESSEIPQLWMMNIFLFCRLSISAVVMSYLQNPQPMTPPWWRLFAICRQICTMKNKRSSHIKIQIRLTENFSRSIWARAGDVRFCVVWNEQLSEVMTRSFNFPCWREQENVRCCPACGLRAWKSSVPPGQNLALQAGDRKNKSPGSLAESCANSAQTRFVTIGNSGGVSPWIGSDTTVDTHPDRIELKAFDETRSLTLAWEMSDKVCKSENV